MLQELALVHSLKVAWKALSEDGVSLGRHLHDLFLWVRVDEAEVLLELGIRRLELKVGGDVATQSIVTDSVIRYSTYGLGTYLRLLE